LCSGCNLSPPVLLLLTAQFAYGACELLFNPLRVWLSQGPFNRKFRVYIANPNIHWYQKVSLMTYFSSYLVSAHL
jgi:hypothetical protein